MEFNLWQDEMHYFITQEAKIQVSLRKPDTFIQQPIFTLTCHQGCSKIDCNTKIQLFQNNHLNSGADLGGGGRGGDASSPSGIRPPADPKGPPFDTFSEIHFWLTDPKIFLKAPSAPIYTNFEGERAPKKTQFFCQNFSKSAQKRLFWLFFQKFACGAENFAKIGAKQCFGRARKINLVDLKKNHRSAPA